MSFVSFSFNVIFIIRLFSTSAFRVPKLKQSYNLCILSECIQWSNREWRPSVWSAAAENFNENVQSKSTTARSAADH